MSNVEQKLQAMGLKLPACPAPVAAYLPVQTAGNLIYASGQTAWVDGKLLYAGKVGGDVSIADAYESAKISAVNCLSDGFIDLIVFSQRIFNRNFLAVSLARYEFRTNAGVSRISEIVLLVR